MVPTFSKLYRYTFALLMVLTFSFGVGSAQAADGCSPAYGTYGLACNLPSECETDPEAQKQLVQKASGDAFTLQQVHIIEEDGKLNASKGYIQGLCTGGSLQNKECCLKKDASASGSANTDQCATKKETECIAASTCSWDAASKKCGIKETPTNANVPAQLKPDTVSLINPIGGTASNPEGNVHVPTILGGVLKSLLGLSGSAALLMFVVGGFMWLTSAGNPESVKKGTQTMVWAAIGVFIIFSSYAILNLVLSGLGAQGLGGAPAPTTPAANNAPTSETEPEAQSEKEESKGSCVPDEITSKEICISVPTIGQCGQDAKNSYCRVVITNDEVGSYDGICVPDEQKLKDYCKALSEDECNGACKFTK